MKVQVVSVAHRNGVKNGKEWAMDVAKCVVHGDDGSIGVGSIILPKDHPKVIAGNYTGTLTCSDRDGDISFRINALSPVKA